VTTRALPSIAVVDYGAGNLTNVLKALAAVGGAPRIAVVPRDVDDAAAVIVPGVGHFAATMALDEPWRRAIRGAIGRRVPLLGICLGMHWLFEGSDEAPDAKGLSWFNGRCGRLEGEGLKVPHVGWNTVETSTRPSRLLAGIPSGAPVYFTHSFGVRSGDDAAGVTDYGGCFTSVVERDLVFGVQFHPEKSGTTGLRMLANFVALAGTSPC
jgi:glutamine amidotransferase